MQAPASFRPGEDLAPGEREPQSLSFTPAADAGGTDLDVLMGYQVFLGRDPESSFVIADAKTSPVGAFIRALMGSGEFQSAVLDRLSSDRPLPHDSASPGPAPEQLDWLFVHMRLPHKTSTALRTATDWRTWLHALVTAPGFPHPPSRGGAPAAPGVAAQAADEGFVLVHLEHPKPGERLVPGSSIAGNGWAIAPADVTEVAVHLDGVLLTHARYGLPRPDVARAFPHYRHVDHCGFAFTAEVPRTLPPAASGQLSVTVRTGRGELGRKSVRLQGTGGQAPLAPEAGAPETWPIRLAVDEAVVDADRTLRLRGWAASRMPLRSLSASIGETPLGEPRHGLPRPDIARIHPGYANAGQSGFVLVQPLDAALPAGPGFVRIQAEDERGRTRQAILPVTLPGPIETAAAPDSGTIRCSCDLATLSADGVLHVGGWAFDPAGPCDIEITLDGEVIGLAEGGQARPDVGRSYPAEPGAAMSGFSFRHRLAQRPEPGQHRLSLRILGPGDDRLIEQGLSCDASVVQAATASPSHGTALRIEIDHPVLLGDAALAPVRGALTISGWAIARQGVSAVSVFCDASLLGHAHLGMRREDIGAAFADYEGALLAGYALVLPPGTLSAGRHRIAVVVTGRAAGAQATAERVFSLDVEPNDILPPGCSIRTHVPPAEAAFGLRLLGRKAFRPVFDILVADALPSQAGALADTLASLRRQVYPDWTATVLLPSRTHAADPRLRDLLGGSVAVTWPGKAAPRAAQTRPAPPRLAMRLRAGDLLSADALLVLAVQAATDRDADFIYADELRPDLSVGRVQPFLKPDWSPDLLLAMNYVGRAWCAAGALMKKAGVPPEAGDYDAVLRLTENAARVSHVTRVLYQGGAPPEAAEAEHAALASCLARRGMAAEILPGRAPATWRVRRALGGPRRKRSSKAAPGAVAPRVSIVMPTCAAGGLVRSAIKTIRATTAPAVPDGITVEIVVLDNTPPRDARARSWLRRHADIVVSMPGPFNWSRFNNEGARAAGGHYLLFLNDDIEAREPGWLEAMLEHAQRPEVGVVGARLLYPDGKVQHAGQYLAHSHARHAFRFADATSPGPFGLAAVAREMISVTGACQMMRADTFHALGGFEEAHSVVNNDLDFCLRSWREGLSVVFTPHATLIHHELASRAALDDSYDEARFAGAWRDRFLKGDPFRNPRLAPDSDHYGADPEPAALVHVGPRGPARESIRRILAVKLDHIGDFLTALPALRSLAASFPGARIDLLAPAATADLARHEPLINETIVFDFFHARSGLGQKGVGDVEFRALQARLAPAAYDMAIDLRMQPETRAVLPYTGSAFLVGYDHDDRFGFLDVALTWEGDTGLVPKRAHISERLVQLVSAAADACRADPAPAPPASLTPQAMPVLAALPAAFLARPLVCVHPGVGNVVRQWPPGHYAALVDLLAGHGLHAVLIGGPDEAAIAEEVLRRVSTPGTAESLVGKIRLAQLPELMRACVLFVGNNSGPQHLAASLGLPTVGIHSGVVDAAEWAPLGPQALAIRRCMICGPCYLEFASDCPRDLACLTGLRPAEVFEQCRRMVQAVLF